MSGSIKYFVYTDDRGNDWAMRKDESNTEAVNAGTQDFPNTGSGVTDELPRNIKPRYLRYVSDDRLVARNVVALTPAIFAGAAVGVPSFVDAQSGKTVVLSSQEGEKRRLPFGADTGLQDGDAT